MGLYRKRPQASLKTKAATAFCGLVALGALTGTLPAQAQTGAATGSTVNLDVVGADLHAVVNMLQQSTHIETTIQDGDKPFKPVNVSLHNAALDKALRTIALSAGATVTQNSDGVYVFQTAGADGSSSPEMQTASYTSQAYASPPPPTPSNMTWHKLALQHAVPSEILKIMHWDQDLRVIDPYDGQRNLLAPSITTQSTGTINSTSLDNTQPSVPIGRGDSTPADQANRSVDPSAEAQQFPGGPTIIQGGGGFQGGGGGFQGGRGGGRFGGNQQGGFGGNGNNQNEGQLPEGVDRIYALEGDNSLFIEANPTGYEAVREIVKNLDIAPRQVQIKVEFVTASVNDVDAFGINFSLIPYPGVTLSNNQGSLASGQSPQTYVQVASGNIVAEMYSTLTQGRGKTVQSPLITTTNNVPAYINVQTQIPYVTTTNVVNGTGTTVSNTQQNFIAINTGLQVTPRINSDDSVTLRLVPVISDTSGQPAIAGGAPPITSQTLQTLRTVHSGETMVLGGLVRKADTVAISRIPILGDLPIIGNLFRAHLKQVQDSELLIFVTPTIIAEDSEDQATSGGTNVSVAP